MDCGSFVSVSVYWNVFVKHHTRIFLCHRLSHLHRTYQSSMCRYRLLICSCLQNIFQQCFSHCCSLHMCVSACNCFSVDGR